MSFQTINPATGETLRTFPMASDAEVAAALKTADDRYNNDWKLSCQDERRHSTAEPECCWKPPFFRHC
jgi:succinate-semialdehyde dehydrogenase/glutarate-semialdehyde dehydrogenase